MHEFDIGLWVMWYACRFCFDVMETWEGWNISSVAALYMFTGKLFMISLLFCYGACNILIFYCGMCLFLVMFRSRKIKSLVICMFRTLHMRHNKFIVLLRPMWDNCLCCIISVIVWLCNGQENCACFIGHINVIILCIFIASRNLSIYLFIL